MKIKKVTFSQLASIYKHPSALLFRSLELNMLYENTKEMVFKHPSLDIGCGDGAISKLLFDDKFTYGMDNGEANDVDEAIKNNLYDKVLIEGAERMSLPSNSLNFVFSNSVIEHIPDNKAVLAEVGRVLKSGGFFVFTSPSENFTKYLYLSHIFERLGLNKLSEIYKKKRNKLLNHYHLYNHEIYGKLLKKHGMEIVKFSYCTSKKNLMLWDKMALETYIRKIFDKNAEEALFRKYKAKVMSAIKDDNVNNNGADLLVIAKKS